MVDEISLIGWRDDIGAYLITQYPRKLELATQDIMQIYTSHRQNTLYPNFVTINYKGKKIASFFSGMKTTEYIGAPNFIISVYLDEEEESHLFRNILPDVSVDLLTQLFERIPELLDELKVRGVIILTQEEDIGGFPVLIYPSHLKVTAKLQSDIFGKHSLLKKEKSVFEINGETFASFYTGTKDEKYLVIPNFIVTFLLTEQVNVTSFKRKLSEITRSLLSEFSKVLSKGLEEINNQKLELMIEDELEEKPIIGERDFEKLSMIDEEPEIMLKDEELTLAGDLGSDEQAEIQGKSIEQMLEQIKKKAQIKSSEIGEVSPPEEEEEEIPTTREDLEKLVQDLRGRITNKDVMLDSLNKEIENLKQSLNEKDQELKKIKVILKSLRKYVSY